MLRIFTYIVNYAIIHFHIFPVPGDRQIILGTDETISGTRVSSKTGLEP
jgi:hypothetical protein